MDSSDNMTSDDDKTMVAPRAEAQAHVCPACGTDNVLEQLQKRGYRCSQCRLELAHVDFAPNGTIRGIFGWLRATGEVVLDRYQIKSVLGKGGFGAAYLADDLQLSGKRRALKEVPLPMFDEYETSLLSKLDHPGIPDIIDRKTVNDMVYLVLKFGGSRTLGSERKQYPDRRLPQEKLFPWMRQLCDVLIYLHGQNPPIVHRDLKPDNILLNEDDRIMLIDFGIAKEAAEDGRTRTLAMAVTVGFSPPEQVMGTGTDARADVYALGATFYALLTGQNPTPAHERIAGVALTPPSQLVSDLPPQVEDAIVKSLNLNMNERQQSVKEFLLALSGVDAMEQSRPIASEEWTQRTVAMDRSTENVSGRPTGLKLPTGRATAGAAYKEAESVAVSRPGSQTSLLLSLIGLTIILAAIVTAGYYYYAKTSEPVEPVPPAATQNVLPTQTPTPEVTQQVPPTPAQIPVSPELPMATPAQTPVAAPAAQPPRETESAQELLKSRVIEPLPEPEPTSTFVEPEPVKPVSKPKPRPKPVVKAPVVQSNPKPSGSSKPAWVIIPGGARKTD
ncbi:protein kinase [Methylomonas sp.]|uniref:serine/threonine protein kinase n=1 Tax=Methylomonas sp. TaxID=418 RepID=UPI0025D1C16D|nr:protein kinase [Methylomonas sp.]